LPERTAAEDLPDDLPDDLTEVLRDAPELLGGVLLLTVRPGITPDRDELLVFIRALLTDLFAEPVRVLPEGFTVAWFRLLTIFLFWFTLLALLPLFTLFGFPPDRLALLLLFPWFWLLTLFRLFVLFEFPGLTLFPFPLLPVLTDVPPGFEGFVYLLVCPRCNPLFDLSLELVDTSLREVPVFPAFPLPEPVLAVVE
jgi:hypothetical protein